MIYILLAAMALTILGCDGAKPRSDPTLLSAETWDIQYSPGMPLHPIPADGGWYFDFPPARCGKANICSVHYVSTPLKMSAATNGHVTATFQITSTGLPIFNYQLSPDNTCDHPAHVRLYLQRTGDDLSGRGEYEFYRWFSNTVAYRLAAGNAQLTAALRPSEWTSVFGKKGDYDDAASMRFVEVLRNLGRVGFVFGGGCFYGHGVNVTGGTARFAVSHYVLE
jgi:hypothetical protein